jgi:hypothetical protein
LTLPVEWLVVETRIVDATLIPWLLVPSLIWSPLISSPLIAPLAIAPVVTVIALVAISVVVVALALLPTGLAWVRGRDASSGSQSEGGQAQHCGDRALGHITFHIHRALLGLVRLTPASRSCSEASSVNRDSCHCCRSSASGLSTMSGGRVRIAVPHPRHIKAICHPQLVSAKTFDPLPGLPQIMPREVCCEPTVSG